MKRLWSSLFVVAAALAVAPAVVVAQPGPPGEVAASAEVKAGTGVENKESVGTATEFAAGTKIWVWSRVVGAAGTRVRHVWKKDGVQIWQATLAVKSKRWVTHSRRQLKAGNYSVDVVDTEGRAVGTVSFTVK